MSTQSGWGGGQSQTTTTSKHDWQTPAEASTVRASRGGQLAFGIWLLLGIGLLGGLVYLLPYSPDKTPVLILAEQGYLAPMPVNGWAADDAELIGELNGQNISVSRVRTQWESVASALEQFRTDLEARSEDAVGSGSCVLYINAHGLVNDEGQACIVTAKSHPHDASTWIPISSLIEILVEVIPDPTNKLVVLDCAKVRSDWNLGVFYNDFSERIRDEVGRAPEKYKHVAVINSASGGQVAWARSNFSLRMMQALAGVPDGVEGLPGDSRVTVGEIFEYVKAGVDSWSTKNRGEHQTPELLGAASNDAVITVPVGSSALGRIAERQLSSRAMDSPVSVTDIADLWSKLNRVIDQSPVLQLDPILVRDLRHGLFRLEQLTRSGPSLANATRDAHQTIQSKIDALAEADWSVLPAQWNAIGQRQPHIGSNLQKLHSLAMSELFGKVDHVEAARLRSLFTKSIGDVARGGSVSDEAVQALGSTTELQLLKISQQAETVAQWPTSQPLTKTARLRADAELHAAPLIDGTAIDLRAHRAIRSSLGSAFESIRAVEDELWLGGRSAIEFDRLFDSASNELGTCRDRLDFLRRAFRTQDVMYAELPYIGQWLNDAWFHLRPSDTDLDREDIIGRYEVLVGRTIDLSGYLQSLSDLNADTDLDAKIREATSRINTDYESLKADIVTHAEGLAETPDNLVEVWRGARAVLRIPFFDRDLRATLLNRFEEAVDEDETTLEDVDLAEKLLEWGPDTADRFLVSEASGTIADDNLNSTRGRLLLRTLGLQSTPEPAGPAASENLQGIARTAAVIRRASALGFRSGDNNVFQLDHVLEARDLLLWTASRALDDCWGSTAESDSDDLFFSQVANDSLQVAEQFDLPFEQSNVEVQSIRRRITRQELASESGITGQAVDDSLTPGVGAVSIRANYKSGRGRLPSGKAAIFVRSKNGQRMNAYEAGDDSLSIGVRVNQSLAVPVSPERSLDLSLTADRDPAVEGGASLVAFFRGHEFVAPVTIGSLRGNRVRFAPNQIDTARVTLFGEAKQTASIMFILDCSRSMGELVPSEDPGSPPKAKLDIARSILSEMLSEIAIRESSRIGLRFFGHRLGWSTTRPVRLLTQPDYSDPIPRGLTASTDVEEVLTLGRFDGTEFQKTNRRLQSVVAWGQSPLNLAILQALSDFERDDRDTDQSIVVITDGVNYQFTPAGRVSVDSAPTSLQAVLRRAQQSSIPVHILGFGVAPDERAGAAEEFEAIADATDGSYRTAANGRDLLELLQSRLGLGKYQVRLAQNENDDRRYVLNDNVALDLPAERPAKASVEFGSAAANVGLHGGEWVQLRLSRSTIESIPYERDSPVADQLVAGRDESVGHVFRVHRPRKDGDSVEFMCSIQSRVYPFTDRPAEVWIEIEPNSDERQRYEFYDAHFVKDEPVPVLKWTAEHWPADATEARVRVWCKPKRTPPTHAVRLSDIGTATEKYTQENTIPGIPGVRYQVTLQDTPSTPDSFDIRVLELHDTSSAGIGSVKIDLVASTTPIKQVDRYFDAVNQLATHTFRVSNRDKAALMSSEDSFLEITTRSAIETDAWHLRGDGIPVRTLEQNSIFPLNSVEPNESLTRPALPKLTVPTQPTGR